jgi:hypothetical protein
VPLELAALDAVRAGPLRATLYLRQVYIPPTGDPDPFYVKPHDGRWGTDWTLHTTGSPPTAWAEYCRHVPGAIERADPTGGIGLSLAGLSGLAFLEIGHPVPARALFALTYEFDKVLDVSAQATALATAGFTSAELYADDYGLCPELARWASTEDYEAIVAPSAAWRRAGGTICAVLTRGRSRMLNQDVVVPSGRPTIAVAAGTTYKAGERPSWL